MTNSTDNTNDNEEKIEKKKAPKKKGPLRIEAVGPIIIIAILTGCYFYFFFDSNLRKAIELGGTYGYGAEVNVGFVKSSFTKGYLKVGGIQLTDKENPTRNLVQIDKVNLQLSWDALLRGKFVVEDATIENIQAYNKRKRPGRILPKKKTLGENKVVTEVSDKAVEQVKEQYNENILGDIANVVDGADPQSQIDKIKAELTSEKKLKELDGMLKEKEAAWKKRLDSLPQKQQIDALVARAKALKFKGNAIEIANDLKAADKIIKEADGIYKTYEQTHRDFKNDYGNVEGEFSNIDKMIQKDIADIQTRLKIPSLNTQDFSKGLFGKLVGDRFGAVQKYADMAKEYMPPPKAKGAEAAKKMAPPRGKGRNIKYRVTTGYPLFWLKKAKISSEPTDSPFSGKINGQIVDATSDPQYLKRPTVIDIQGDFPKQQIKNLVAKITLDHTTPAPKDTLDLTISAYPVDGKMLSESEEVTFGFQKASGALRLNGEVTNAGTQISMINYFSDIDYKVVAKSSLVDEILKGVVKDIPKVHVVAKGQGQGLSLNWSIKSNLGDELSAGFKKQIQAKIEAARAKIKASIDEKINQKKSELMNELNKGKNQVNAELAKHKEEVDKAKAQLEKEKNKASNQKQQEVKKALDKGLKDLKKKIKLPW